MPGYKVRALSGVRKLVVAGLLWLALAAGSAFAGTAHAQSLASGPQCAPNYYKNVNGVCVHRPSRDPRGATAKCRDGTYSYSRHASGTCSHHGGVARWIHHP
jgi:hypothetical protein